MTPACPECGSPVAPGAAVCAQCGFPLRPDAITRAGGPSSGSGSKVVFWVLGLAAVGLVLLVVLGIVVARMVPRLAERQQGGDARLERLLRDAWLREQMYRAEHGHHTGSLADLRTLGLHTPPDSAGIALSIVLNPDDDLCIQAEETRGEERVMSIDAHGSTGDWPCGKAPAIPPATKSDEADRARELLQRGYTWIDEYRTTHGGQLPAGLIDLPQLQQAEGTSRFRLDYFRRANGEMCLSARPRTVEGPERSVNEHGELFMGSACSGTPIERFAAPSP